MDSPQYIHPIRLAIWKLVSILRPNRMDRRKVFHIASKARESGVVAYSCSGTTVFQGIQQPEQNGSIRL